MQKVALITGITGQDGSYLAKLLLDKGYTVHGTTHQQDTVACWRHDMLGIKGNVTLHACSLTDAVAIQQLVADIQPDELYHLAAQSSVAASLINPGDTLQANIISTLNLLEALRGMHSGGRFFNASSADIFDPNATLPLTESSPIRPTTPYGTSKAAAHLMTGQYRGLFGLFAVNGILFPHESPLRQEKSFIKRLIHTAVKISQGAAEQIPLGNIDNGRDFGDAREFVEAMWHALQHPTAHDYVICTGNAVHIKNIVEYVLQKVGVPTSVTFIDTTLRTSMPQPLIYGSPAFIQATLGWSAKRDLYAVIDDMIQHEQNRTTKQTLPYV